MTLDVSHSHVYHSDHGQTLAECRQSGLGILRGKLYNFSFTWPLSEISLNCKHLVNSSVDYDWSRRSKGKDRTQTKILAKQTRWHLASVEGVTQIASFVETFLSPPPFLAPFSPLSIRGHFGAGRASLGVQLVKNPLAMRETWVRSLGWEMYQKKILMDVRLGL